MDGEDGFAASPSTSLGEGGGSVVRPTHLYISVTIIMLDSTAKLYEQYK